MYRVRQYAEASSLEEAVERTITECIREGILKDFLEKNRAEAKSVSIFEYDEEEHMRQEREQFWNKGIREGMERGRSLTLISQVQKKLDKGKSISQIAEELEEEVPVIERIYKAVAEEPEADLEIIFEKLKGDCKS